MNQSWAKLVAIAALPRSGTTVTAALLGANSRVHAVFEPWNGHRQVVDATESMTWSQFVSMFAAEVPPARDVLLVKETTTLAPFVDRLDELLKTTPVGVDRQLVVLARNPFHIFLSQVQARREWWGAPEATPDAETFVRWARRARNSLRTLGKLAREHDALVVPYESLTTKPNAPRSLTRALGLQFEEPQLTFNQSIDRKTVRGDIGLSEAPRPLSDVSIERRQAEFKAIRPAIEALPEFRWAVRQRRAVRQLAGISRFSEDPAAAVAVFEAT